MKRILLSFAVICGLATPGLAEAPKYYNLVELAADDPLNVRAEPFSTAEIIGTIAPGTTGIEVAERDCSGRWGKIIWNETNGWIAVRFLDEVTPRRFAQTELPDGLVCSGTEPFWGLSLRHPNAIFSTPNSETVPLTNRLVQVAAGRARFPVSMNLDSPTHVVVPIIRPSTCSDGMSDRTYPWEIDMIVQSEGQQGFLTGCCHLPFDAGEN